jgi:ATP-dependent Lon protease
MATFLSTGISVKREIMEVAKVIPVGGIKEKLLAAHREGIKEVVLPLDNMCDLKDIPKKIKKSMKIHFVETMDEVLKIALTKQVSFDKDSKEKVSLESDINENKDKESQDSSVTH